jgi:uncharacterized protein YjbI with pentapeptide repeats
MIKKKLIDPALEASDIVALEKASSILHSVAEAEKIEVDISASTRAARAESLRFWIPILAPVITALALIGTLVFQIQQFKEAAKSQRLADEKNAQSQRLANEDTQWREVLAHAKSTEGPESAFALTLIKSFFDSERYKKQAREVAAVVLGGIGNPTIFDDNFAALLEKTNWDNFKDITNISRTQATIFEQVRREADNLEKQREQSKTPFPDPRGTDDPAFLRENFGANVLTTSKGLVQFLRDPRHNPRPANIELDLSGCAIWEQDVSNMDFNGAKLEMLWFSRSNLSGANFSGAKLYRASIIDSNVKDADFSGVQANYSYWNGTAWWRAQKISPDLLKFLQDKYKFSPDTEYRDDMTKDFSEYQKEVKRLSRNQ